MKTKNFLFFVCLSSLVQDAVGQERAEGVKLITVAKGWANNSVNAVIFRKNSLVTYKDSQFISFYDENRFVILAKRKIGSTRWQIKQTKYQGNAKDAHNTISIMADGDGYLHLAWDHHNNALHYCRSVSPGSLEVTSEMPMTGRFENRLSYPEFYRMPDGNLLFFYRDGGSGRGNLVINQYSRKNKEWKQLQSNLIDGEGERNAYWQACVDKKGVIHLSWVWRETPDVASNHDMCYARSLDGGITWERSTGEKYVLPIKKATAEYITRIPQKSELINQTSITADEKGNPFIASYWRDSLSQVPQYRLLYKENGVWKVENTGFRKTSFSLSGGGTKRIPISRPQVIAWNTKGGSSVAIIFRDAERGDKVSAAIWDQANHSNWRLIDLTSFSLGSWEPTYDTELWRERKILQLFIQKVEQADAEGNVQVAPQPVQVLEWFPQKADSKKSFK